MSAKPKFWGCYRHSLLPWPFLLGWALLFFSACATPSPPQGGPRDETPPQLIEAESTPNYQTNFEKQTIELTFDEWVVLEQVRQEVVISPPLEADPEIKLKRRTVQLIFPDTISLRENATYTINFGEAVKDLNEKNPADDLRFVFSTGPFIDSLTLSGQVVDAQTGAAVEEVLFMLYENTADSVVRTQWPFYFGKTDETGRFRIENIRAGTYKGFALEDKGIRKYIFEDGERLAFADELIPVRADTNVDLTLQLFAEALPLRINDLDSSRYGLLRLTFNQKPEDVTISTEGLNQEPWLYYDRDSLLIWYDQSAAWTLYIRQDTLMNDTIQVIPADRGAFSSSARLMASAANKIVNIVPGQTPRIRFNHPLTQWDTSRITLFIDTTRRAIRPDLAIDTSDRRQLLINHRWQEGRPYQLELLPGAVTDIFGLRTVDTLLIDYRLEPVKKYGNLQLTVDGLSDSLTYLIQLTDKELKTVFRAATVKGQTSYTTTWRALNPAVYTVRIITDWNENGHWDTGSYQQKRQPEPIYLRELERLRANWDLDASVRLGEVITESETPSEE